MSILHGWAIFWKTIDLLDRSASLNTVFSSFLGHCLVSFFNLYIHQNIFTYTHSHIYILHLYILHGCLLTWLFYLHLTSTLCFQQITQTSAGKHFAFLGFPPKKSSGRLYGPIFLTNLFGRKTVIVGGPAPLPIVFFWGGTLVASVIIHWGWGSGCLFMLVFFSRSCGSLGHWFLKFHSSKEMQSCIIPFQVCWKFLFCSDRAIKFCDWFCVFSSFTDLDLFFFGDLLPLFPIVKKTPSNPPTISRWWFQIFFIFTPIWGRFPIWLICFKWVESTN